MRSCSGVIGWGCRSSSWRGGELAGVIGSVIETGTAPGCAAVSSDCWRVGSGVTSLGVGSGSGTFARGRIVSAPSNAIAIKHALATNRRTFGADNELPLHRPTEKSGFGDRPSHDLFGTLPGRAMAVAARDARRTGAGA